MPGERGFLELASLPVGDGEGPAGSAAKSTTSSGAGVGARVLTRGGEEAGVTEFERRCRLAAGAGDGANAVAGDGAGVGNVDGGG